jgi:DNA-binding LacI/PurR family transcriptional regulator
MGAVKCLNKHGLHVPDDISITGFDDVSSQYASTPRLTSISFSRTEMGTRAITMLCESDGEPLTAEGIRLPVTLVEHESVKSIQSGN